MTSNSSLVCRSYFGFGRFLHCSQDILRFEIRDQGHQTFEQRRVPRHTRRFVGEGIWRRWVAGQSAQTFALAEEEAGVLGLVEGAEDVEVRSVAVHFVNELF